MIDSSGDGNWLHEYSEMIDEFADENGFIREPTQDGPVVVNQGMSAIDATVGYHEGQITEIRGFWPTIVYSTTKEDQEQDQLVLEQEGPGKYRQKVIPGGEVEPVKEKENRGGVSAEYAENPEIYGEDHNENVIALMGIAVGRGFETPGFEIPKTVRNGELLMSNSMTVNKLVDWDEVRNFEFDLEERTENKHSVTGEWNIDVEYEETVDENALTYEETSTYVRTFHEMDSVQEKMGRNPYSSMMSSAYDAQKAWSDFVISATTQPFRQASRMMRSD